MTDQAQAPDRCICLHGHFYQPPRENPWLEAVELQDSAYPFHDWNERITFECYAPNASARILDGEGRIERIVNNYARISFNFGPTLLSWMETHAPQAYGAILEADRLSRERHGGHGSALAQVYNHMILPLANRRDRATQVLWGIRDFRLRFGREPEGMWLAETAADTESLDALAERGIRFTILAPHQARRVRKIGGRSWRDVSGGRIDPTMPYEMSLPSGRKIAVFFYDGPISRAVAFEGLLRDGGGFARRLLDGFADERARHELMHIATDGETYGHHHRHGEMALAYALDHIESSGAARLTNYGAFLERHPPSHQAEIFEKTSWSCSHGVDRWWRDCGCNSGRGNGWNQSWRTPLRNALDWLRDALAAPTEELGQRLLRDPWLARDEYIDVVLDRSRASLTGFLSRHAARELSEEEVISALRLLELQRHLMLMYTSCGWFFDELSGIETVQVIQYAGRAAQLARELFPDETETGFLKRLAEAKSNLPEHGDGARIYEKFVKPTMLDLLKVGAHYAISSLFESYGDATRVYCYEIERHEARPLQAGRTQLVVGKATITSEITRESALVSYGVCHLGDQNVQAGVRAYKGEEAYQQLASEAAQAFARGEFPDVVRCLDRHFGGATFSLKPLFRDEQRKIVHQILQSTLAEVEANLRQIHEHHAPLSRFLNELGEPLPKPLRLAAEFILNTDLRRTLEQEPIDLDRILSLMEAAASEQVELDASGLGYALGTNLEGLLKRLVDAPSDLEALDRVVALAQLARSLPFRMDSWKAQNLYYSMLKSVYPEFLSRGDEEARRWVARFAELGELLSVRVQ